MTCTPDDVAADESRGAEPSVFDGVGVGDSGLSVDRAEDPSEIVFSGIATEIEALAPPETNPKEITPVDFESSGTTSSVSWGVPAEVYVDFDGTAGSVFSGTAEVIDALAIVEVMSGPLGLGSTKLDGSAVSDFSEANVLAPVEADSSLPDMGALFPSFVVDGLRTDSVGCGMIGRRLGVNPLLLAPLASEVPLAEVLDVILSGSGLTKLLLLVAAADSLSESSLDGAVVILGPTGRLGDVTAVASSDGGLVVFSPVEDRVLLAGADSDSEDLSRV